MASSAAALAVATASHADADAGDSGDAAPSAELLGAWTDRGLQQMRSLWLARGSAALIVSCGAAAAEQGPANWRVRDRMKTVSVALVLCLNVSVDPPDVIKTSPCARMECWLDPMSMAPQKALDAIGRAAQMQFERWQPRARYKQALDPTVDDIKKLCLSLRRNAKDERVLFFYNGHGVPRPTSNGELWVFNKNYTQYIPLSVFDLQSWLGTPSIYVIDCSNAGQVARAVETAVSRAESSAGAAAQDAGASGGSSGSAARAAAAAAAAAAEDRPKPKSDRARTLTDRVNSKEVLLLAACSADELLPMNPDFPADLFTACLTTPIKMALRWFITTHSLVEGITLDMVDRIPGRLTDRKEPLGELNWIFTAVTDTIAWNVLPRALFQRLFRQDLLVASLFRNYLLAERIMRSANVTPVSMPRLPPTYNHPMWQAWDFAADVSLAQLPQLLKSPPEPFRPSSFFTEQLTAFEVWLEFANQSREQPEQLPIVLQVLLSQTHRLRALVLLGRFLDTGAWAVQLALSVGIFPYVLKLLQSPAADLRHILVFIWAKILRFDRTCQADLVKDNGHTYFINFLNNPSPTASEAEPLELVIDAMPERVTTCSVLCCLCDNFRAGQQACLTGTLIASCLAQLSLDGNPLMQRWLCLSIAKCCENFVAAKLECVALRGPEKLRMMLDFPEPEVRAAAVFALANVLGSINQAGQSESDPDRTAAELDVCRKLAHAADDASPTVRMELVVGWAHLVHFHLRQLVALMMSGVIASPVKSAISIIEESGTAPALASQEDYVFLWSCIKRATLDPSLPVSRAAGTIVAHVSRFLPQPTKTKGPLVHSVSLPSISGMWNRKGDAAESQPLQHASPPETAIVGGGLTKRASGQDLASIGNEKPRDAMAMPAKEAPANDDTPADDKWLADVPSSIYASSCTNLSRPLMVSNQRGDDPFIAKKRAWQFDVNGKMHADGVALRDSSESIDRFEERVANFENEGRPVEQLLFHSFEPYLVAGGVTGDIFVWDFVTGTMVNRLEASASAPGDLASSAPPSKITALGFANEQERALLLTGCSDGSVRAWRDFEKSDSAGVVTAWSAVPEMEGAASAGGLVFEMQQQAGLLLCAGDSPVVRVWDLQHEMCAQTIAAETASGVTSICSLEAGSQVVVAGCKDGTLRLYDRRKPVGLVRQLSEHTTPVVNAYVQRERDMTLLVSGAQAGEIKLWDVRESSSISTVVAHEDGLSAIAAHTFAPLIASGSRKQKLKVFNAKGEALSTITHHAGFLGQRIGPVSCLAWRRYSAVLAFSGESGTVSLVTA